jgi:hypothetical protein
MTGILPPVSGVGARISGSTPDGGHSTPSDLASLSPSGSWDWPTVESRGAFAPPEPIRSQLVGDCGGGAVCCGGVAGLGGACAIASADVASNAQTINSERFICMRTSTTIGSIGSKNGPVRRRGAISVPVTQNWPPARFHSPGRVGRPDRKTNPRPSLSQQTAFPVCVNAAMRTRLSTAPANYPTVELWLVGRRVAY